jgi:hypothetical protein
MSFLAGLCVRKLAPLVSERLDILRKQRVPQRVKAAVFRSLTDALIHLMVRRRLCSLIPARLNLVGLSSGLGPCAPSPVAADLASGCVCTAATWPGAAAMAVTAALRSEFGDSTPTARATAPIMSPACVPTMPPPRNLPWPWASGESPLQPPHAPRARPCAPAWAGPRCRRWQRCAARWYASGCRH